MATGVVRLDLSEEAIEELLDLAAAADKLPAILEAAAKAGPQIGMTALAKQIADEVGIVPSELRRLMATLVNFYHTQTSLKLDAAETAQAVSGTMSRMAMAHGGIARMEVWEEAGARVVKAAQQLNPDHPLEMAYKSYRVATSRQYDLVEMRILTDARPVFNAAGDEIRQTIITHVLSLVYHNGHDHRIIQFTLDATDVVDLRQMCERAERKAAVLKRDLKGMPWPTSIFREPVSRAGE
jgi:hypothetical protein